MRKSTLGVCLLQSVQALCERASTLNAINVCAAGLPASRHQIDDETARQFVAAVHHDLPQFAPGENV